MRSKQCKLDLGTSTTFVGLKKARENLHELGQWRNLELARIIWNTHTHVLRKQNECSTYVKADDIYC
jgi:hypothetical protein